MVVRKGGYYVGLGYALMFFVSLGFAVLGAVTLFTGVGILPLVPIYLGCLVAFGCCITLDAAYTYYKKKTALVELVVPRVTPAETARVGAPMPGASRKEEES